jgi:hypothetical protein
MVVMAASTVATPAAAYRTAGDLAEFAGTERVRWAWGDIGYRIYKTLPDVVALTDLEVAVQGAFGHWSSLECGGPVFEYRGATWEAAAPDDGVSTIEWVSEGWTERGFPDAAAFTDVTYTRLGGGTWEIREADLYINGAHHQWAVSGAPKAGEKLLSTTLTHEAGHMLGLLHVCEVDGENGAPLCSSSPDFAAATMHPLYDESRIELGEDDVAGACFLYAPRMTGDAGAPPDESCVDGSCLPGDLPPGDSCTGPEQCTSRYCSEVGLCAKPCLNDEACPTGATCKLDPTVGQICSSGLGLGAACKSPADCLGEVCLRSSEGGALCSRSCAEVTCPEGWTCGPVDGDLVCTPAQRIASGGCATATGGTDAPGPFTPIILLTALCALARALSRDARPSR